MEVVQAGGVGFRRWLIGCAVAAPLLGLSRPASADDDIEIAAAVVTVVAVNLGFVIYDAVLLTDGRDVNNLAAATQLSVATAQTATLNTVIVSMAADGNDDTVFGLTFPAMLTAALATHGAWSLARPTTDPETLMLGSSLIGVNEATTMAALGYAAAGRMSPPETAVTQLVTGLPSLATSAYLFSEADSFRSGWMFLTVWSGLLVTHGALSLAVDDDGGHNNWADNDQPSQDAAALQAAPTFSITPDVGGGVTTAIGVGGRF